MPIASIGTWEFLVPDNWNLKGTDDGVSYLESEDRTNGMYVKCIELQEPKGTARAFAEYIQNTHEASFRSLRDADWQVVNKRDTEDRLLHRSALDMLDRKASYRVLSLVACDVRGAIQLTLHDYLCENYESVKDCFAKIESSIARVDAIR